MAPAVVSGAAATASASKTTRLAGESRARWEERRSRPARRADFSRQQRCGGGRQCRYRPRTAGLPLRLPRPPYLRRTLCHVGRHETPRSSPEASRQSRSACLVSAVDDLPFPVTAPYSPYTAPWKIGPTVIRGLLARCSFLGTWWDLLGCACCSRARVSAAIQGAGAHSESIQPSSVGVEPLELG